MRLETHPANFICGSSYFFWFFFWIAFLIIYFIACHVIDVSGHGQ